MAKVKVIQPVEFHSGVIGLSKDQAEVRAHALAASAPGLYEIRGKISFKAGELLDLRFPVPKALRDALSPLAAPATKKDEG